MKLTIAFPKILFLVALFSLQACSPAKKTIRVGAAPWPNNEYLFIAKELKLFPAESISIFELPSSTNTVQALQTAKLDVAFISLDQVLTLINQGTDLKIITVLDQTENADYIISNQPLFTLSDLAGKTVGYANKTSSAFLASDIINYTSALNLKSVKFKEVKQHNVEKEFHRSEVDALIIRRSQWPIYKEKGAHKIPLNGKKQSPRITTHVIAVRTSAYENNQAELILLLKGYYQAYNQYQAAEHSNRKTNKYQALIEQRLGISAKNLQESFKNIKLLTTTQAKISMSGNPAPLSLSLHSLNETMIDKKMLERDYSSINFQQLIVTEILEGLAK
jgi:NitT/TauT family transport system substrate-binding protein